MYWMFVDLYKNKVWSYMYHEHIWHQSSDHSSIRHCAYHRPSNEPKKIDILKLSTISLMLFIGSLSITPTTPLFKSLLIETGLNFWCSHNCYKNCELSPSCDQLVMQFFSIDVRTLLQGWEFRFCLSFILVHWKKWKIFSCYFLINLFENKLWKFIQFFLKQKYSNFFKVDYFLNNYKLFLIKLRMCGELFYWVYFSFNFFFKFFKIFKLKK